MFGFLKDRVKKAIEKVTKSGEKAEAKQEGKNKSPGNKPSKEKAPSEKKPIKPKISKEDIIPAKKLQPAQELELPEIEFRGKSADEEKKGFFGGLFSAAKISDGDLEELKLDLVRANVSIEAAEKIISGLKGVEKKKFSSELKNQLIETLGKEKFDFFHFISHKLKEQNAVTILFFGFNGAGKTTTIAKLGNLLKENDIPVVFAAGDTFRAAAIEQLAAHAHNLNIDIVKHKYGGDPAAVIFDARKHAEKLHGVVLGDTAGRLHTDKNLMEELKKVIRVNKPDFKILVLDSLTGSDIQTQLENFSQVGIDGIIFTKADINEKGGSIFSVRSMTDKPVLFLGTGQGYNDLMEFDPEKIVEKLDL
jgi:fused signal recognition particle receptor